MLRGREILIVDDNVHMLRIINTVLRAFGADRVIEATDPAAGFEIFRDRTIDLIIVDYRMDVLDGFEFVRLVRTADDSPNKRVPIVMVTAYSERSKVKSAVEAGVNTFVRKPFTARDLYQHIVFALNDKRDFLEISQFAGPDRRRERGDPNAHRGPDRRSNGAVKV
jgi:CheY-like chemotaxis protein